MTAASIAVLLATAMLGPARADASTVTVTTTSDSGAGSLRGAIGAASNGDTITFAPGVSGTITLTGGELVINKNLTIDGPGVSVLTISGNDASRVFFINPGAPGAASGPPATSLTVNISDLTIANGRAKGVDGGAGLAAGGAGGSAGMGGGLFINNGAVTLTGVVFRSLAVSGG
jgi:hypothetical protein